VVKAVVLSLAVVREGVEKRCDEYNLDTAAQTLNLKPQTPDPPHQGKLED